MTQPKESSATKRSSAVTFIAVINGVGAILTIAFWGLAMIRLPSLQSLNSFPERAFAATTRAFMIADLMWALPLLIRAAVGLWRERFWGWLASQMVNVLWWYSVSVVLVRDLYTSTVLQERYSSSHSQLFHSGLRLTCGNSAPCSGSRNYLSPRNYLTDTKFFFT